MGGAELEDLDFGNRMKQSEDGIPYSEIDINDVPYDH